ncbi:hypothetical protein M569_11870 [Genlisea aurea]|uniref:Protein TRIGALACTOSYLDIACYLGLYCEROL 4, chloroplastic n=1 Tax=Genlisea aurea TaxID=192259 RepID=S8DJA2_9LAMI|nr:hypothetical protein M569_11870 [Genlisea aurea]
MKKLRWIMDCGFCDVDVSTPFTVDGVAKPVPDDPLPLGLSRGAKLSRPKQIDFLQRFMAAPFVPSFSNGLSFQRVFSFPLPAAVGDSWFATFLGQFNAHRFVSSLRKNKRKHVSDDTLSNIWRHLSDHRLYALNFCSEWSIAPDDTLLLSLETHGDDDGLAPRKKAVYHHKFLNHDFALEAASPSLFVDRLGNYWDVPLTLSMDLSSAACDSGPSFRFCINHKAGSPRLCEGGLPMSCPAPPSLLPGSSAKCDVSFKKNFEIWRSGACKKKMVLPYDVLLSNPHVSASAVVGTVAAAYLGDNLPRNRMKDGSFWFLSAGENSAVVADLYAAFSFSAQLGNFQKRFLDLTRFCARIDIPSGSKFSSGASRVASNLLNSPAEAVRKICPSASLSFQQQICGPFSLRVDADVSLDEAVKVNVVGIEHALQVLGSAKAVAWYSLKQREFMVELRFFET